MMSTAEGASDGFILAIIEICEICSSGSLRAVVRLEQIGRVG